MSAKTFGHLDDQIENIRCFNHGLFVVKLLLGKPTEDGFEVIHELRRESFTQPIVVCDKSINNGSLGKKMHRRVLKTPGVVGAYEVVPNLPIDKILSHL